MTKAPFDLQRYSCPVCGGAITLHQTYLPGHCGKRDCARTSAITAEAQRQADKKAYYAESVAIARSERAGEIKELAAQLDLALDEVAIGVVPHRATTLKDTTGTEMTAYVTHLDSLLAEAFANDDPKPSQTRDISSEAEEPYPWNTQACTACEGHCCAQGGGETFAFHTTDLILHLRQKDPSLRPETIREHYTQALPDQHIEDACLFQGPRGCTLTRDWRADICNTFRCYELRQLADQVDPKQHKALAMFSIRQRTTKRMTFYATKDTSGGEG